MNSELRTQNRLFDKSYNIYNNAIPQYVFLTNILCQETKCTKCVCSCLRLSKKKA